MPYPQQIITYQDFLNYVNTEWVTNGNGDITGVIGNNVVNALYQYITKSYFNYKKATIYASGGNLVLQDAVNVITTVTPSSLQWQDNLYNEYVIINTTTNVIPLANGFRYYSLVNTPITSIPANSVIVLFKEINDNWIQGNNLDSAGGQYSSTQLAICVNGEDGSPIANTSVYQNDLLIGAKDINQLTINKQIFYIENSIFTVGDYIFDADLGVITFNNYLWNFGDQSVIPFSKLN